MNRRSEFFQRGKTGGRNRLGVALDLVVGQMEMHFPGLFGKFSPQDCRRALDDDIARVTSCDPAEKQHMAKPIEIAIMSERIAEACPDCFVNCPRTPIS